MIVRPESQTESVPIRAVQKAAFPTVAEANLVDQLRTDGDVVFSLVAVEGNEVIGHVIFSRMEAPFRALALGPVAVIPGHQRKRIGARLIEEGLSRGKIDGWDGVFVLGAPAYYQRFGFDVREAAGFTSPYAGPHLMALSLQGGDLPVRNGKIAYPRAFAMLDSRDSFGSSATAKS